MMSIARLVELRAKDVDVSGAPCRRVSPTRSPRRRRPSIRKWPSRQWPRYRRRMPVAANNYQPGRACTTKRSDDLSDQRLASPAIREGPRSGQLCRPSAPVTVRAQVEATARCKSIPQHDESLFEEVGRHEPFRTLSIPFNAEVRRRARCLSPSAAGRAIERDKCSHLRRCRKARELFLRPPALREAVPGAGGRC